MCKIKSYFDGEEECPKCGSENTTYDLWNKETVCKKCGHYF